MRRSSGGLSSIRHSAVTIRSWRERGAISQKGKRAALAAFAASALVALLFVSLPYSLMPLAAALIGGTWIWTRPDA